MNNDTSGKSPILTWLVFGIVAAFICLGGKRLEHHLEPMFEIVDTQLNLGQSIVMDADLNADSLKHLLLTGGYIANDSDARYISRWYADNLRENNKRSKAILQFFHETLLRHRPIENLGAINTSAYQIPADSIRKYGGPGLRARLQTNLENIGQLDSVWMALDDAAMAKMPTKFGERTDSTAPLPVKVVDTDKHPVPDVAVRITEHWYDDEATSNGVPKTHRTRHLGFVKTDRHGKADIYLPKGKYYSVLPIRAGYSYGDERGTVRRPLEYAGFKDHYILHKDVRTFTQKEHKIKAFSTSEYSRLKSDKALIVRTPAQYKDALWTGIWVFLLSWAAVFAFTQRIDRKQKGRADRTLLFVLMILTAMGVLTLYGLMLPLSNVFDAFETSVLFIPLGCLMLMFFSRIDIRKLHERYFSKWPINPGDNIIKTLAPSLPFLGAAAALMLALWLFGTPPEGSDARVNLGPVQPSEIVKYILVAFMAYYFLCQGQIIRNFSRYNLKVLQLKHVVPILLSIAAICLFYLAFLKDMGPGLVILSAFIIMYSIVRGDTRELLLGIATYVAVVLLCAGWLGAPKGLYIGIVGWFLGWWFWGHKRHGAIYESAMFFNFMLSMFLVGGNLLRAFGEDSMADRLDNRTGMTFGGIFDNTVPAGDQIAQGLWGSVSGGFSGMGLGGGSAYFIPAGHTDLILNSLGEQLGFLGILVVALCFALLTWRTIKDAQYAGHPFPMYVCLGIGLLTGAQFLLISLGCMGVFPLSGVPVPFISKSGTSLCMAMGAYGIVVAISRQRGSTEALRSFVPKIDSHASPNEKREAESLNSKLAAVFWFFAAGIVVFMGASAHYQIFSAKELKIRPAITYSESGLSTMVYNPRIQQVIDRIERGNIYDRHNRLLATSDREDLKGLKHGPARHEQLARRLKRYYPYGNYTVFMTGDQNNSDVYTSYSAPLGYFAESRIENVLSGYDLENSRVYLGESKYYLSRFGAPIADVGDRLKYAKKYDFSFMAEALDQPIYRNSWIDRENADRHKRDIYLTIDAELQTLLSDALASAKKQNGKLRNQPHLRASVVVINATTGDLLASSMYPLPDTKAISRLRELKLDRKGVPSEHWSEGPVAERDLGTTWFTAPGSTAKVMTAMAGLVKDPKLYDQGFAIKPFMSVEPKGVEPNIYTPEKNRKTGNDRTLTYMDNAIKHSSNCYFIMSLNENDLYPQLGNIYWTVGASLAKQRPYFFYQGETQSRESFDAIVEDYESRGLADYAEYMNATRNWPNDKARIDGNKKDDTRLSGKRVGADKHLMQEYTGIAWGQSTLEASPLVMARVAGIVGNDGIYVPTRYTLNTTEAIQAPDTVLPRAADRNLAAAMASESKKHQDNHRFAAVKEQMGGKTGTPNRDLNYKQMNDAWYMCYFRRNSGEVIAVALRLERLPVGQNANSALAVEVMDNYIIPTLQKCKYLAGSTTNNKQ